jgi:intracellular septation protein A
MAATTTSRNGKPASGTTRTFAPVTGMSGHRQAARFLAVPAVSLIVYFAVRPFAHSDAAGLAVAGAVPAAWTIALVLGRRRVDLWAVLTSLGFALGCIASLLAGRSSLPLKLHEAAITFLLGVILLGAVLARRPLPIGRVLKVPHADRRLDTTLNAMIGAFLILHALLHLALAVTLPTATYLVAGRAVNWAAAGVGALCLYSYLRRARQHAPAAPSPGDRATHQQRKQ